MNDPINRQMAIDAALLFMVEYCGAAFDEDMQTKMRQRLEDLPSAQPELIERTAYIRGFEQGRTQGMIDSQAEKSMIKAEWTNADTLDLQQTCNNLATDCISRQAAIDDIKAMYEWHDVVTEDRLIEHIKRLPSAQPDVPDTNVGDIISRQVAIDRINKQREHLRPDIYPQDEIGDAAYRICAEFIERLPSAQPKPDEWCTDCKEYDSEKHCCPRFNRVIRNALKDAQPEQKPGKWIVRDNPGTGWYRVTCSECGEDVTSTIPMIGFFPNAKPLWDYCPYCGAKMEDENE